MKWYSTDLDGVTEVDPDAAARRALLEEAERHGAEAAYPEVFLGAAGWGTISYRAGGVLLWERETDGEEWVLRGCSLSEAAAVWEQLVAGDGAALERHAWESLEEPE